MSGRSDNLIVGLDIGTTKICAIVGNVTEDGLDIVGIGTSPSRGLRKGVVINIESTVASIKKAVEEAELMAGCEIKSVYAGIAGGHIRGFNSQGIIAIKNREVSPEDVKRVIEAAKAIAIPMDREVIHILPQEFIIDDQDGIREPLGMSGVRLEAKVHIVTGAVASAQNIIKSCNRAGLDVADIVLEQLASSEAVLSADEKELGVALIDIGGGTTDIAIFVDGAIKHTSVLSLGGNHMTNDIAVGLRTPMAEAEKIKQKYGCCLASMVGKDETIEVPSVGGRNPRVLSRQLLAEILEPQGGGDFLPGEPGDRQVRFRGHDRLRHRHYRRKHHSGRNAGACRADLQPAGPPGPAAEYRRAGGCGEFSGLCNRCWPGCLWEQEYGDQRVPDFAERRESVQEGQ